jgi:hypothetical protein
MSESLVDVSGEVCSGDADELCVSGDADELCVSGGGGGSAWLLAVCGVVSG